MAQLNEQYCYSTATSTRAIGWWTRKCIISFSACILLRERLSSDRAFSMSVRNILLEGPDNTKEKGYYVIISNPGPDKSSAEVIENSIPMAIHRIRVPQAFPIRSGMVSTLRDYEKKP